MAQPEIIIQDFGGRNAQDLKKTSARLIKGGSWKKQRVVVILPAASLIPAKAALSHWNLIFPPNNPCVRILAQGLEVGDAYSKAIDGILGHPELSKWEYILTIEQDNCPPPDGLLRLLEQMEAHKEFSCIGGLYFTKGEAGVAQIWGDVNDPVINFRPQLPIPGQLVECYGTGMGFNLFRLKMFKDPQLKRPLFETKKSREGVGTQDLAFWGEARKYGYRCAIDCSVRVGHYDHENDVMW